MSYTSGNKAPTLMAQAPNRVGNKSKNPAQLSGGVTAVTRPSGGVMYSAGHQGAAKTGKSVTSGNGQKVMVSRPECYDKTPRNDAYMGKSTKNYLG
jgi:hypothetical protein